MNYHLAILAVLKTGSGLTQRAHFNRIRGAGITANDAARALLCTPRYCLKMFNDLESIGAVKRDVDHSGIVGRPAYRWHLLPDVAEVVYTGSNDPDMVELFWHDALSELYTIRAAARRKHAAAAIGWSFDNAE